MEIICLDIATTTGYAIIDIDTGKITDSNAVKFTGKTRGEKLHNFYLWLNSLANRVQPFAIAIESPFFRGAGTRLLMPMCGMAEMVAHKNGSAFIEVNNQQIKKHLLGTTKVVKEDILACIVKKGYKPVDDNEADAIALALYVNDKKEIS